MSQNPRARPQMACLQVCLSLLFLSCLALQAVGTERPTFAEFVRQSETILSGTVERSWVETDRRVHAPVVRLTLSDVRRVKGSWGDTPRISFWSPVEDSASAREGVALEFRRGERYVFLLSVSLDEKATGYVPILASRAGLFRVLHDASRRRSLVHDAEGRPIARASRDRLVLIGAAAGGPGAPPRGAPPTWAGPRIEKLPESEDPGTRVSEQEFLRLIREILGGSG